VGAIILGPTPGKGETREFTRWEIENRLLEMGVTARVSFTGNEQVLVLGGGGRPRARETPERLAELAPFPEKISSPPPASPAVSRAGSDGGSPAGKADSLTPEARKRLAGVVADYLAGRYRRPDVEIAAEIISFSGSLPDSVREIQVEEAAGRIPGKATFRLGLRETPASEPGRTVLVAEVKLTALALVASRQLRRGEVLAAADVKIARIPMESGRSYLPPRREAAAGRELARDVGPGAAIFADEAVPTAAVKRGEMVQSVTRDRGWEIAARGKALSGGMIGDLIQVEDSVTRAKYQARITDRGVVSVVPGRNK
jgi:flagella basal body P-ring formation protein FlgA